MGKEVRFTNGTTGRPVFVYVQDGRIVRVTPMEFDQGDAPSWTIKARGRDYTPPKKFNLAPFIHAERTRLYSEDRIQYPLKRVDFDPSGDRNQDKRGISPYERISWLYRIRSFLDYGLTVVASSDSPIISVSPLVGIYAAVTRRTMNGQIVSGTESISPLEALRMYTINGAYASYEEKIKGMISPGKLADLVLLSDNPLTASAERIKEIKVEMTTINGRIVWCA